MATQALRNVAEIAAVSGEHAALIDRVAAHLPLLADLVAGDLALFAPACEPNRLVALAEGRPTVCRSLYPKPRLGEILDVAAEPLVARCLRSRRARRRGFVALMGGQPVEQVALPLTAGRGVCPAVLSAERSVLNGPWAPASAPLRQAAANLGQTLLGGAVSPSHVLWLLRMAQGASITEAGGGLLYADAPARRLWLRIVPARPLADRLPPGVPAEATVVSEREEAWGREWEFEIGSAIYRRRDLPLGPAESGPALLVVIQDVSHVRTAELLVSARSAAIQEIHHRIKNNLQTISSLLRMQARRETSPQAVDSLRTAIGRVLSVAFVHEALSRDGPDEVDLKALATTLVESALNSARPDGPPITYAVLGPRLALPAAKASQVALVLNELVQNAVKHAFPGGRGGGVTIRLDSDREGYTVTIQDDGVGLPPGFDLRHTASLGLQIAQRIVESDLGGQLQITGNGGTTVVIRLPATLAREETQSP
jgi:two-component system, sensor histidine kinase PdtaS